MMLCGKKGMCERMIDKVLSSWWDVEPISEVCEKLEPPDNVTKPFNSFQNEKSAS
jgi:hypothetical protein